MAYSGIHYRTPAAGSQSTPVANLTDLNSGDLRYLLGVKYSNNDPTPVLVGSINSSDPNTPKIVFTNNFGNNINVDPTTGVISAVDTTYTAASFDISQLADTNGLRNTWSGKQDTISVDSPLSIDSNNKITIDLSGKQDTFTVSQPLSMSNNNLSINLSNYATTTSVNNIDITITAAKEPSSISDNNIQMIYKGTVDNNSVPIAYVPYTNSSAQTYSKEYYATSDKSLKENVTEVTPDSNIFSVPIVEFNWKDTKAKSIGVIAQDLEKVAPVAVSTSDSGIKSVNYTTFLLLRIAALEKELKEIKEKLS